MSGSIPLLSQYFFMAWCLVKQRDNFTFTFNPAENQTPVTQLEPVTLTELKAFGGRK
jgi:hypothetical protein